MSRLRWLLAACTLLSAEIVLPPTPSAQDLTARNTAAVCACGSRTPADREHIVRVLRQFPDGGYALAGDVAQHVVRNPEAAPVYFCPEGANERQKIAIGAGLRLAIRNQPRLDERFRVLIGCADRTIVAAYAAADGTLVAQLGLFGGSTSFPAVISPSTISGGPVSRHTVP